MLELVMAVAVAAIAVFFLVSAFSNASTGTPQKVAPHNGKPQQPQQQKPKKPKKSKKELAAQRKEDDEIERLITSQGHSVTGMPTDKAKVVSLEDIKTKKEAPKKASGNRAAQVTTKQRVIDQEAGFSYVEKKVKSASPVNKDHDSSSRNMDKELTKFFKQADKRGKDKGDRFTGKKDDKESKSTGTVSMKKKFTSDPTDLWAQGRTFE